MKSNYKFIKSKKMKPSMKILLIVLCVLVLLAVVCTIFLWINLSRISSDDLGFDESKILPEEVETEPEDLSSLPEVTFSQITPQQVSKDEEIIDLVLVGVDNRNSTKFTGRSDVTMYLRVDTKNQSLKLISLMRDTLVSIEGHDVNRLNTAYNFGSIDLLNKTLEANFGLDPDYYIVINFYGMEDIINTLGGIDIDIESNEISNLNKLIKELNELDPNGASDFVDDSGEQHLNGRQAVAYMRIRKIGGDAMRIQRQQTVLSELFKKLDDISITQIPGLINTLSQYVRTDVSIDKIIEIAKTIKNMEIQEIQRYSYPAEYKNGKYNGMSVVQPENYAAEIEKLRDFLEK